MNNGSQVVSDLNRTPANRLPARQTAGRSSQVESDSNGTGALLVGTGLALASLILVPALAIRVGLGASVAGALRIALMKASYRYGSRSDGSGGAVSIPVSCH